MEKCIYCRENKKESEFSLEHVIPQFLGGVLVSDMLKTRKVCKQCNNNLGLFVDASFEKDWIFHNYLNQEFRDFYEPNNSNGLPLSYMGIDTLIPPHIDVGDVCEVWLGSLGEIVYLIRPNDDRLYWYAGGNPRTAKTLSSVAYFFFSERSLKNPKLSLNTFLSAFKGKKVRRIVGSKISGIDLARLGFNEPNDIDKDRIDFFLENLSCKRQLKYSKYIHSDKRFIAKLGIGLLNCLFPYSHFQNDYLEEMYKMLWYRNGECLPRLRGCIDADKNLKILLGVPSGITIAVMQSGTSIVMSLNIAQKLHWIIKCAGVEELDYRDRAILNNGGRVFIIYRALGEYIEMSMDELILHKTNSCLHKNLQEVELILEQRKDYFRKL